MTKYKTVKRKANVGERILITNAEYTFGDYDNGDIFTVIGSRSGSVENGVIVKRGDFPQIFDKEYEVIIEESSSNSERITALETQVAELQAELQTLKKRKKPKHLLSHYPTPNEQRKAVIERAKAFVAESLNRNYPSFSTPKIKRSLDSVWFTKSAPGGITDKVEFIVNVDKRTVVALIKTLDGKLVHKGIAKCAPDDVFNADIGKAIALGRALGLDVSDFENAPKPTEVVVGMVVRAKEFTDWGVGKVKTIENPCEHRGYWVENGSYNALINAIIIDDTEAQYV